MSELLVDDGFGFVGSLDAVPDVNLTTIQNNQILVYNSVAKKWVNVDASTVIPLPAWGNITGDLDAQSDLWLWVEGKAPISHVHGTDQVTGLISSLEGKQNTLVSGTNIRTINNNSLLGSGDITLDITGFTSTLATASPNNTVNASRIIASGGTTNQDIIIAPKGTGAIISQLPDSTATGGNKRGARAIDLQTVRGVATQVASGSQSVIVSGGSCTASSQSSAAVGGNANSATTNPYCGVFAGQNNVASGSNAVVLGGNNGNAYLTGQVVIGGYNGTSSKARQHSMLAAQGQTTTNAAVEMFLDGFSNRLVLKNNTSYTFDIDIVASHSTTPSMMAKFSRSGSISRSADASSTVLDGAVQTIGTDITNAGISGISVAVTADTANGSLKIACTGKSATTINWEARIMLVELEM